MRDREVGLRREVDVDRVAEAAFGELTGAETVAFGGVGIASTVLPVTKAYRTIEDLLPEHGEQIRSRLAALLAGASPAGRVYAAALLDRLDPGAGRAAWATLRTDPADLNVFTGCILRQTTVAGYAAERLG